MEVEIRSLTFTHLLTFEEKFTSADDWLEPAFMLESFGLNEEVYRNGPIFFSVNDDLENIPMMNFTYYIPLSKEVECTEEAEFNYLPSLHIDQALFLRQIKGEMNVLEAYEGIENYAESSEVELEDIYYCVLHKVHDEYIIDFYVPIKEGGSEK